MNAQRFRYEERQSGTTLSWLEENPDRLALPWDLREWLGEFTILGWIEEDIERLEWDDAQLVGFLRAHPAFRPRSLLCLLTYAYATGTFGSDDVTNGCYEDPMLRAICGLATPTRRELNAFRRENRGLLKKLLNQLFSRAMREKLQLADQRLPAGLKKRLEEAASTRIDLARHMDRAASD